MNQLCGIIVIVLFLLSTSCNNGYEENSQIQIIDIESNINNMEIINLSQFTDDIRYVPLKTYQDLTFQGIWKCVFSDSMILAYDMRKCLLYDYNGNTVAKIGQSGRGPGEYNYIKNADFGAKNNILIHSQYDLFEYNLDGTFLKQIKNYFRPSSDTYISSWDIVKDSLFLGHVPNITGLSENKALMINKYGHIKNSYKNYILFQRDGSLKGLFEDFAHIYSFNNSVYYKECFNDTLFSLDNDFKLIPKYILKLGKYMMPISKRKLPLLSQNFDDYITLWEVFQTEKYLLLNCSFANRFPAKRLTPRTIMEGTTSMFNTTSALGIYDKKSKKLVFCKPTSTDNPLFTTGIYNNIDAGPRFYPTNMVNDSTMVMWLDAKKLKDHVASNDFKNNMPKYPEKKKELFELANKLTVFDNPILMFVTFKK